MDPLWGRGGSRKLVMTLSWTRQAPKEDAVPKAPNMANEAGSTVALGRVRR